MELITCEKNNLFQLPMKYFEGESLDNKIALGKRFTFILIETGTGIAEINNRKVPFISPVVFCINEKEHIIINDCNTKIKAIFFHPSIINCELNFENVRRLPEDASVTLLQDSYITKFFINRNEKFIGKINVGPLTVKNFSLLCDSFNNESNKQYREHWPCRSRSYIMELLFLCEKIYINDNNIEVISNEIDDDINSVLIYIYNNYSKKITISELTKKFNINRTTLSKKFNEFVGESIITYLNKIRVNMASIMLRDTGLPVSEIMERVGFLDSAHFLRTFKSYMKMTPTEYREKYCWL